MAGDGQCDCRKDVFYILVYKVPREISYDLSICPLYSNHSPIPYKKKKKRVGRDLFALSLLKNPSSSWPDLILLFFSGIGIKSLVNKFCLSGVELLYR